MVQDQDQAQNDVVEEQTAGVMPTPEEPVEDQQESQLAEEPQDQETEVEEPVSDDSATEESDQVVRHKPTRVERNLKKALGEKKELSRQLEQTQGELDKVMDFLNTGKSPYDQQDSESSQYFTEEELAEGVIDPKAFQQRVDSIVEQKARKIVTDTLRQEKNVDTYKRTVEKHVAELEELAEKPEFQDEAIAEAFTQAYNMANHVGDRYVPQRSPKEIADLLFGTAKRLADKQTSNVTGRILAKVDNQAVAPNATGVAPQKANVERLYQQAIDSGTDDAWASYFKAKNS